MGSTRKIYLFLAIFALILGSAFSLYIVAKKYHHIAPFSAGEKTPTSSVADPYTKNLNELLKLVDDQDPRMALAELQHRMDTDSYMFQNCHAMAHEIGHEAYKKYNDFVTALSYEDVTCSDGYLHGIIEERFSNVTDIYGEMKKVCAGYTKGLDRCYHGVGHGVMYYTANDLPRALQICKTYKGFAQKRCNEGVFMENFISGSKEHPSKYLDPKNITYPCPEQSLGYKDFCYFYVPYYFLHLHNYDYTAAAAWCSTVESGYVSTCVRGVGSIAMKYHIKDPKYVEAICDTSVPSAHSACISGMVSYYLTFTSNLAEVSKMCTLLEPANKIFCDNAVKQRENKFILD
jgi:hypothetical protein